MMDENIASVESIITHWDTSATVSLFTSDRNEARLLRAVADLQQAMLFFVCDECGTSAASRSHALVHAQNLMQTAVRRLQREFHNILSSNGGLPDQDTSTGSFFAGQLKQVVEII